jgi:anaerobic ribonucleoside-triphosphate reductase activating protein
VNLHIHATTTNSTCNGPGRRIVIWTQGCSLACSGCFNPITHGLIGGEKIPVEALAQQIDNWSHDAPEPVRGITLSGGEPLAQPRAVAILLGLIDPALDVLLYTGFEPDEIRRSSAMRSVIRRCDAVLAGRFYVDRSHPYETKALMLRTNRILPQEIRAHRMVEFVIDRPGGGIMTGFPRRLQ